MVFLIIGCGKVGSSLAERLANEGHVVNVVASSEEDLARLGDGFSGRTFLGFECDQNVLESAGIKECDVVAAVSHNDNINIMAAQIARDVYRRKAVARIYDPALEEFYSENGLQTVCPVNLIIDSVYSGMVDTEINQRSLHFGLGTMSFNSEKAEPYYYGHALGELAQEYAQQKMVLLGLLHSSGNITMAVERPDKTVVQGDRFLVGYKVD